ncbi:hypothetical protein [Rubellimicrobium sp. CFH 75288]|uniref:hypothetical protein n=1 Tax=Rubellimicrobium sp. CFH 75288 TaxID=2697034 RepID=UPI0014121441|nr:hypothetical protein [Rubellimicrobium sp. CFH 75288]NAZ37139.1 hypothetical protein [Rubellimicrobium sp. CFH 75288]
MATSDLTTAPLGANPPPTPVRAAFECWRAVRAALLASSQEREAYQAQFDALLAAEATVARLRAVSVEDFALKILVADDFGDMSANTAQAALVAEARQIAGVL